MLADNFGFAWIAQLKWTQRVRRLFWHKCSHLANTLRILGWEVTLETMGRKGNSPASHLLWEIGTNWSCFVFAKIFFKCHKALAFMHFCRYLIRTLSLYKIENKWHEILWNMGSWFVLQITISYNDDLILSHITKSAQKGSHMAELHQEAAASWWKLERYGEKPSILNHGHTLSSISF